MSDKVLNLEDKSVKSLPNSTVAASPQEEPSSTTLPNPQPTQNPPPEPQSPPPPPKYLFTPVTTHPFVFADHTKISSSLSNYTLLESLLFLLRGSDSLREIAEDRTHREWLVKIDDGQNKEIEVGKVCSVLMKIIDLFSRGYVEVGATELELLKGPKNSSGKSLIKVGDSVPDADSLFNEYSGATEKENTMLLRILREFSQGYHYYRLLQKGNVETAEMHSVLEEIVTRVSKQDKGIEDEVVSTFIREIIPLSSLSLQLARYLIDQYETIIKRPLYEDLKGDRETTLQEVTKILMDQLIPGGEITKLFYTTTLQPTSHEDTALDTILRNVASQNHLQLLKAKFSTPLPYITELSMPLFKSSAVYTRFDTENNGSFGLIDLSTLKYINEKQTLFLDMIKVSPRSGNFEINSFKVDIFKNFCLTGTTDYQDAKYMKRPKVSQLVSKLNEIDTDYDYTNDFDVICAYEKEDIQRSTAYISYLTVDERVNEATESVSGVKRVYLLAMQNRRLVSPAAIKIVYSPHKGFKMEAFAPLVYVSEDNDEPVRSFLASVQGIHFKHMALSKESPGYKKTMEGLLNSMHISLDVNLVPGSSSSKIFNADNGLTENTLLSEIYEKLYQVEFNKSRPLEGSKLMLFCHFKQPNIDNYNPNNFSPEKSTVAGQTQTQAKTNPVLSLQSNLTDILDYVIYNDRFKGSAAPNPKPTDSSISTHPALSQLPIGYLLPLQLIVAVRNVNNLCELTAPFEMECCKEVVSQQKLAINTKYKTVGLICKKKQASPKDPLVYYPVKKVQDSLKHEVIGYLPKEVKTQIFKVQKDFVEYIYFERFQFNPFV